MSDHPSWHVFALGERAFTSAALGAISIFGFEQNRLFARRACVKLVKYSKVVDHPDASALCGNDQAVIFNGQVGDRNDRKVQLKRSPSLTIVKRDIHCGFSTRIEQPFFRPIFAQHSRKVLGVYSFGDELPALTVIFSLV